MGDSKEIRGNIKANENISSRLAQAMWYLRMCRETGMPTALQRRLLFCINGCSKLWKIDIIQIITNVCRYPDLCRECSYYSQCSELSDREIKYLKEKAKYFISLWSNKNRRIEAIVYADKYYARELCAVDVTDEIYPPNLAQISSKPAIIFCEGKGLNYLNSTGLRITIVGTRAPTPYGLRVTEILAGKLAQYDCAIISGLALGIDTVAHQSTLDAKGFTVAVTAGATDTYYPYKNKQLQEEIAEKCLIISEQIPGTRPIRQFFPARNRILSGLADIVIVTEAPKQSGTLITTNFAGDFGRQVFAVPGNILQQTSKGCNCLILDGAELLDDIFQIVERYKLKTRSEADKFEKLSTMAEKSKNIPDDPDIDEDERQIMLSLEASPMTSDQLANKHNIRVDKLASILTGLELKSKIQCKMGRYFLTYE